LAFQILPARTGYLDLLWLSRDPKPKQQSGQNQDVFDGANDCHQPASRSLGNYLHAIKLTRDIFGSYSSRNKYAARLLCCTSLRGVDNKSKMIKAAPLRG
jgi:hypothetical protein